MTIVASTGIGGEIGREGDLCWHIPADLRHFKAITTGGAVVMGRKTWESLPRRPLPGRTNIVVSRSMEPGDGFLTAPTLDEALHLARERHGSEVFVIGGASVYEQAMPLATALELTEIEATDGDADTFFPAIDPAIWQKVSSSETFSTADGLKYRFVRYENRNPQP